MLLFDFDYNNNIIIDSSVIKKYQLIIIEYVYAPIYFSNVKICLFFILIKSKNRRAIMIKIAGFISRAITFYFILNLLIVQFVKEYFLQ